MYKQQKGPLGTGPAVAGCEVEDANRGLKPGGSDGCFSEGSSILEA
jgi:hypothetical protein